jgi:hypothetical protein
MLLLAGGALVQVFTPFPSVGFAAGLTAGVFTVIGLFGLLWGGAHVWTAMLLRKRQPFGRIVMLGLALINLLVLPFGTALGVYALWVLLTNEGRHQFEPPPTGVPAR